MLDLDKMNSDDAEMYCHLHRFPDVREKLESAQKHYENGVSIEEIEKKFGSEISYFMFTYAERKTK